MEEGKALAVVAAVFVLVLAAALFKDKIAEATKPMPPSQTPDYCEQKGAAYKSFTNWCMDSCESIRANNSACTTVLTTGCDCGPENCWNGFECEANNRNIN